MLREVGGGLWPAALAYPLRWARDRSIPTLVPPELGAVRSARMPGSPTLGPLNWALATVPRSHCPPGGWPARSASVLALLLQSIFGFSRVHRFRDTWRLNTSDTFRLNTSLSL
jgi:hypothetical protein